MKKSIDKKVSFYEIPASFIARTLKSRGYKLGSRDGENLENWGWSVNHNAVGILRPQIKKGFSGFITNLLGVSDEPNSILYKPSLHLGTLWIDNDKLGAKEHEKWVLDVYGRKNIPELTELVKELARPYNVPVETRLVREESKEETPVMTIGFA